MFKEVFEWREDQEYGGEGWIPVKHPGFNASSGLGVAHDTMEHFKGDDGSIAAEMRAFGAMMYIRLEGGYFHNGRNVYTPEQNMAFDIGRFMQEMSWDKYKLKKAPRTCRIDNEWIEDSLEEILRLGVKSYIDEAECCDDPVASDYRINQWKSDMRSWMRVGYRKARRRYHNAEPYDLSYMFQRIVEKVDKMRGDIGQRLEVMIDPKRVDFRLNCFYPYEADY